MSGGHVSQIGIGSGSRGYPSSHSSINNLHFQDGSWSYRLPCDHGAVKADVSAAKMTSNSARTMPVYITSEKDFLKFKKGSFSLIED